MSQNPLFYKGLLWCFGTLYLLVAFISFWHCIAFCLVGNPIWISVMMSFAFEVGLAATLFSILTTENKNTYVAWTLMTFLTGVQVIGNVYSVYKYMVETGTKFYTYIQDSMLHWFVDDVSNQDIMSIISIILGALLPIVALLMTAMVSNNLKLLLKEKNKKEETSEPEVIPITSVPVPDNKFANDPEIPEVSPFAQEEMSDDEKAEIDHTKGMIDGSLYVKDPMSDDISPEGISPILQQDHAEDFNLGFKEEIPEQPEIPIQEVIDRPEMNDVSILDIDNQPTKDTVPAALEPTSVVDPTLIVDPTPPEPTNKDIQKGMLKGVVGEGDPFYVGHTEEKKDDDKYIKDIPEEVKNADVKIIESRQGPFSLFRPDTQA